MSRPLPRPRALLLDLDDTILDDRSGIGGAWRVLIAFLRKERPGLPLEAIGERTDWFWSDPERERRGRPRGQRWAQSWKR